MSESTAPDLTTEATVRPDTPDADQIVTNVTVNQPTPDDVIDSVEEALPVIVTETKAGYRTTEFWVTVVTGLAVALNGIPLPESKEGYVLAGLAAVYAVARGLAKKGIPSVEPTAPLD